MEIKYNIQGLLIYTTMGLYLLSFLTNITKRKTISQKLFLLGFLVGTISLTYRTIIVKHIPMQNLFEVFLSLGALIYPTNIFLRKFYNINDIKFDSLLGLIVLFPAGFVFSDAPEYLPPSLQSPLFGPHVAVYMLAYIIMAKAGALAFRNIYALLSSSASRMLQSSQNVNSALSPNVDSLLSRDIYLSLSQDRQILYSITKLGFVFLTIGLILGSIWGKLAWGHYWNWDPKELWSLASWLVYVGYFHYRYIHRAHFHNVSNVHNVHNIPNYTNVPNCHNVHNFHNSYKDYKDCKDCKDALYNNKSVKQSKTANNKAKANLTETDEANLAGSNFSSDMHLHPIDTYLYLQRRIFLIENIFIATGLVFIIITLIWVNLSTAFSGLHSYAY